MPQRYTTTQARSRKSGAIKGENGFFGWPFDLTDEISEAVLQTDTDFTAISDRLVEMKPLFDKYAALCQKAIRVMEVRGKDPEKPEGDPYYNQLIVVYTSIAEKLAVMKTAFDQCIAVSLEGEESALALMNAMEDYVNTAERIKPIVTEMLK